MKKLLSVSLTAVALSLCMNSALLHSAERSNQGNSQSLAAELLTGYPVGFRVLTQQWKDPRGEPHTLEIAVWYPAVGKEIVHAYPFRENTMASSLIPNGQPIKGKFPLVLYAHAAAAGGTSSAFLTEALARKGYVVAAVDYTDRFVQVRISRPVSLGALKTVRMLRWLYGLRFKQFGREADRGRTLFAYRPEQTKLTINRMLRESDDVTSPFYEKIIESKIGIVGHSFGAWTSMMLGGADSAYRDQRVKAIVALSGPVTQQVYNVRKPREVGDIHVPIIFMYGQKEPLAGRPSDKALLYDLAQPPKFLLSVQGANHFTFSGGIRKEFRTIDDFLRLDQRRAVITYYTRYFFDYYLKGDEAARKPLSQNIKGVDLYLRDFGEYDRVKPGK